MACGAARLHPSVSWEQEKSLFKSLGSGKGLNFELLFIGPMTHQPAAQALANAASVAVADPRESPQRKAPKA